MYIRVKTRETETCCYDTRFESIGLVAFGNVAELCMATLGHWVRVRVRVRHRPEFESDRAFYVIRETSTAERVRLATTHNHFLLFVEITPA